MKLWSELVGDENFGSDRKEDPTNDENYSCGNKTCRNYYLLPDSQQPVESKSPWAIRAITSTFILFFRAENLLALAVYSVMILSILLALAYFVFWS